MLKFWNMQESITEPDVLDMYIYGNIVTDKKLLGSKDDLVAREFIKDLRNYPNASRINVRINSGGGEVFAAVAIAQQLKKHSATIHTYNDGVVASAATFIFMAGSVRHMTVSSLFMMHLPSTRVEGNKYDLDKGKEVLIKVEELIHMTYKDKTNLSDEELTEMIDHETWLTAPEAYKYGFVTDIEEMEDNIDNLIQNIKDDLVSINGTYIDVAAFMEPNKFKDKLTYLQQNFSNSFKGGKIMDLRTYLDSLPVDTKEQVELLINESNKEAVAVAEQQVVDLTSQLTDTTAQLTTVTEQLTDATGKIGVLQDSLTLAEAKLSGEEKEDPILKDASPEVKAAILDSRAKVAEVQAILDKVNAEAAYNAFKGRIEVYDNLPLEDKHVTALFNLSKAAPADFAAIESLFKVANSAVTNSCKQLGTDGEGLQAGATAYDLIENKIKLLRGANPAMDYNTAMNNVIRENPELYSQYRDEV